MISSAWQGGVSYRKRPSKTADASVSYAMKALFIKSTRNLLGNEIKSCSRVALMKHLTMERGSFL